MTLYKQLETMTKEEITDMLSTMEEIEDKMQANIERQADQGLYKIHDSKNIKNVRRNIAIVKTKLNSLIP